MRLSWSSRQVKINPPGILFSFGYIEKFAAGPSCQVRNQGRDDGVGFGLQAVLQQRELRGMSVRVRAVAAPCALRGCAVAVACFSLPRRGHLGTTQHTARAATLAARVVGGEGLRAAPENGVCHVQRSHPPPSSQVTDHTSHYVSAVSSNLEAKRPPTQQRRQAATGIRVPSPRAPALPKA